MTSTTSAPTAAVAVGAEYDGPPTAPPWVVRAVLLAATSVVLGVIWDISWHRSIGRDTSWTPAHMAIYLGGVLAGVSCGWLVLRTTFAGTPEARAGTVSKQKRRAWFKKLVRALKIHVHSRHDATIGIVTGRYRPVR